MKHELLSRYVLFSCEGTSEGVVIERLAENGRLLVPNDRIVKDPRTFRPFTRARKASDIEERFFAQNYAVGTSEGLLVARIVDSRNAKFTLSRANRNSAIVRTFITAPEIDMLIIHAERVYDDWLRKSRQDRQLKPSEYCSQVLGYGKCVKQEAFLKSYWADCDRLVAAINDYAMKRGRATNDEHVLRDLLA